MSESLLWSRPARAVAWSLSIGLIAVIFVAPLLVIALASFAGQWNGALPSGATLGHYRAALRGGPGAAIRASLLTGAAAGVLALVSGTWSALALRRYARRMQRLVGWLFFLPSAVPSVSVGLGLLVAFSRPPLLLNGTVTIVIVAHYVMVSAFAFGAVTAGIARFAPEYEDVAASLGAKPGYRLLRITLPMLRPYLIAAFGLAFALSMGELGATVMIYPPRWVTLPVSIFALADRGDVFSAAALTILLVVATLALLLGLEALAARIGVTR